MSKDQNLLLVTEHYPCGAQESYLETEIEYLTRYYNVHVITTDTDRLMTRALPKEVTFSRPAEKTGGLKRLFYKIQCLLSHGYAEEKAQAKERGVWNKKYRKHTLGALVESKLMYDYVRTLEFFEQEKPLTIYSANLNNYVYGLCCLKEYCENGIKVVTRCHNANMYNPQTHRRRDTLNYIVNHSIDGIYFTSERCRERYLQKFTTPDCDPSLFQLAPMGVRGQERGFVEPLEEYYIRIVSCSQIEDDKRLSLLVDALSQVEHGCIEWDHIGSGAKKNDLIQYAKEKLGSKTGIRYKFFGKLSHEEIYEFYRDTYVDAFVSVSISESVPTAMMEAMANRIFVVATEVDGVRDVVNNQNGMLMPPDITTEQLKTVLEGLCRISKENITKKGEAAYHYWQEHLNADVNCDAFARQIASEPLEPWEEESSTRESFVETGLEN